jgi:hypothetical protein
MNIEQILSLNSRADTLLGYLSEHLRGYLHQRQGDSNISIGHAREALEFALKNPHSPYGLLPGFYKRMTTEEFYRRFSSEVNEHFFGRVNAYQEQVLKKLLRDEGMLGIGSVEYNASFDVFESLHDSVHDAILKAVDKLHENILYNINQAQTDSPDEPKRDDN